MIGISGGIFDGHGISEMLYQLNTQVFILTCMFGLYLALKIAKPFIDQLLQEYKRSNKSGERDE